jgi:hypothetical protein
MKTTDWANLPRAPAPAVTDEESRWVFPEKLVDQLPLVFADAPPLPGEEARYAQVMAVLAAAKNDPKIKAAMTEGAKEADELLVKPLFQFRNYGQQLPHNWSTISNESAFGTDYFTCTAVAKSNILVNSPNETKYFYQDLDESGSRLNSANRYTVTFPKDGTPPVYGFWSLFIYNEHYFFVANPINRFSIGTKNKDLKFDTDRALTIYVQADEPKDPAQRANWLPAPKGDFSLYIRAYWPNPPLRTAVGPRRRLSASTERSRSSHSDHTTFFILIMLSAITTAQNVPDGSGKACKAQHEHNPSEKMLPFLV